MADEGAVLPQEGGVHLIETLAWSLVIPLANVPSGNR